MKYVAKIRNLCMLQLPSIVTFALHFGGINKGGNDSMGDLVILTRFFLL
jgi:hypothetical protein